ncbi:MULTISPECIES: RNA polymerase subunit sigma-24 [Clostridium]|jgi:toxin-associated regulator BotR|uniref:RNA polymerase subunit sigma-24 n=1 Tax=Clostridium TaxID=1485 RepID=UPI002A7FE023|nr:RNA polymerase subunit sigma-24 [Clostridium tertium]MDY4607286.1 RNA polymerase subunit sigma-24 [Clostridium tertium]
MIIKKKSILLKKVVGEFIDKINYISFKYNCTEHANDFIIFLIELLKTIDLNKFKNDIELKKYITTCLYNKGKKLFVQNKKLPCVMYDVSTLYNIPNKNDDYQDIFFNDIIKNLPLTQRKVIFYKYNNQMTDIEIASKLNISRQAVNKANRLGLMKLKSEPLL